MKQYRAKVATLTENSQFLSELPDAITRPIKDGFVAATHIVYILAAGIAVLAFLLALNLKEIPLRTQSALQEMQQERAAAAAAEVGLNNPAGAELALEIEDAELVAAGRRASAEQNAPLSDDDEQPPGRHHA